MPVDKIKPLKFESPPDGTETDAFPAETDPAEDYLYAKGVAITDNHRMEVVDNELSFFDPVSGPQKLSALIGGAGGGLSEAAHRVLDTLVHNLSEGYFLEAVMTGAWISGVIAWETPSRAKKLREVSLVYASGKVSQIEATQYNSAGIWAEKLTLTLNYTGAWVTNVVSVRTSNP